MPDEYFEELGRRIAAAYVSLEMGTTAETQYRKTKGEPIGSAWIEAARRIHEMMMAVRNRQAEFLAGGSQGSTVQ
jgi:hypothetical protein